MRYYAPDPKGPSLRPTLRGALGNFGPFNPVGLCDGCAFDYSVAETSALFDLPARSTFLAQEQISFQGGAIQLLLNADGSYGEFDGRADGSYSFVRTGGNGETPIPEAARRLHPVDASACAHDFDAAPRHGRGEEPGAGA